ncbi:MAG: hypothetical protein Q9183_003045 [Haloplaca sp. 2 TL-2023]
MNSSNQIPPNFANIDALLNDVSNQMARSQLFRRLSANSSKNSSPSGRRSMARVVKPQSIGGTPQGVQRRRTTTAHTARGRPSLAQNAQASRPLPPATQSVVHMGEYGSSSAARPMTWHPGSYPSSGCPDERRYDNAFGWDSSVAVPNSGNTAELDSSSQSFYGPGLFSQAHLWDDPSLGFMPPLAMPNESLAYGYGDPNSVSSSYSQVMQFAQQDAQDLSGYNSFYGRFQTSYPSQCSPEYSSYASQQTQDSLSSQKTSNPSLFTQNANVSQITKQRSKELVGMGLYDGPSRKDLSTLNRSPDHISHLLTPAQGKGLKLEETWQPPQDHDDDEDEENYSTDEAEDDLPPAPAVDEAQSTVIPAYGDLSNQSFFFEHDDPCTDYMSFDQGMPLCQPKGSDPPHQNFMWF